MESCPIFRRYFLRALAIALGLFGLTFSEGQAALLKEAVVSQVIKDVKLLPEQAAPRPATVRDEVRDGTAVRTGVESRAELTFTDETLARLGANTIFSFREGTRNLELGGGAMLLQVPKNAGGAQITTAAVTAAITGTTVILEYHRNAYIKFIVLEGTGRMFLKNHVGESVLVHAGQMLIVSPNATSLPDPVDVDLERLTKTSLFLDDFAGLPSRDLIAREIRAQLKKKTNGILIDTNLVIFGRGTTVALNDPTGSGVIDQARRPPASPTPSPTATETMTPTPTPETMTPTPTPTPAKYGALNLIASATPYQIGSGTTIQTDPAITTNKKTDYGKIYRGPGVDLAASSFFFGATSAFDTSSGFNDLMTKSGAAFKFTAFQLIGNPIINTKDGEIRLMLIGVNGITSGGPGGLITFGGLESVLLATQNGAITLGSEISFSGFGELILYARGIGGDLTLGSNIDLMGDLHLFAEHDIFVTSDISVSDFVAYAGNNFDGGVGGSDLFISAGGVLINAIGSATLDGDRFNLSDTTSFSVNAFAINATGDFAFSAGVSPAFIAGAGGLQGAANLIGANLSVQSGGDIHLGSVDVLNDALTGSLDAAGSFTAVNGVRIGSLIAGTAIDVGADLSANTITAGTTIDVGGQLISSGTVSAGGDVTADGVNVVTINTPTGVLTVGANGIHPFIPGDAGQQHTFTVDSILSPNGIDFSGNQFDGIAGLAAGGRLTINADILRFDVSNGIGEVNFNGADAGSFSIGGPAGGGDGGVFVANASSHIIGGGSNIFATTGSNQSDSGPSGAGGQVTLNAGGNIFLQSTIQVSSNDPVDLLLGRVSASGGSITLHSASTAGTAITLAKGSQLLSLLSDTASGPGGIINITADSGDIIANGQIEADGGTINLTAGGEITATSTIRTSSNNSKAPPPRGSASGGQINLTSSKATGVAINVTNTGQLLALLDAASTGPGGKITILATGASSQANLKGSIQADRGTIDVRHTGNGGEIYLGGSTDSLNAHADVLKVGALGAHGTLTIGQGILSADDTLKLYATGSNGRINFIDNVTIGGANFTIIAGNTVTISNGKIVKVNGARADVYTGFGPKGIPNANYTGFGGNGSTTGTFGGAGANSPQPIANAPPFDGPPGG